LANWANNFETIWNQFSTKVILAVITLIFTIYSTVKAYTDINASIGIDAAFAPFSVKIIAYLNVIVTPIWFLYKLLINPLVFSLFIVAILFLSIRKSYASLKQCVTAYNKLNEDIKNISNAEPSLQNEVIETIRRPIKIKPSLEDFVLPTRKFAIISVILLLWLLGWVLYLDEKDSNYYIKNSLVSNLILTLDASSKNHCKNEELKERKVIFMDQGRVLVADISQTQSAIEKTKEQLFVSSNFHVEQCY
jgi:hypothetical protein